jgi:hypothetical protein
LGSLDPTVHVFQVFPVPFKRGNGFRSIGFGGIGLLFHMGNRFVLGTVYVLTFFMLARPIVYVTHVFSVHKEQKGPTAQLPLSKPTEHRAETTANISTQVLRETQDRFGVLKSHFVGKNLKHLLPETQDCSVCDQFKHQQGIDIYVAYSSVAYTQIGRMGATQVPSLCVTSLFGYFLRGPPHTIA